MAFYNRAIRSADMNAVISLRNIAMKTFAKTSPKCSRRVLHLSGFFVLLINVAPFVFVITLPHVSRFSNFWQKHAGGNLQQNMYLQPITPGFISSSSSSSSSQFINQTTRIHENKNNEREKKTGKKTEQYIH